MITNTITTPAAQLRKMAAWMAAHADEIVPHGGAAIIEDGVDLCITLHIRDPHEYAPTISVAGRTEFIALEKCTEHREEAI